MPVLSPTSADLPPPAERKAWREVACNRCRQPLYFPKESSRRTRTPFLFCRKCGGRTPVPTLRRRLFQVAAIVIFLAACAFVVFTILTQS